MKLNEIKNFPIFNWKSKTSLKEYSSCLSVTCFTYVRDEDSMEREKAKIIWLSAEGAAKFLHVDSQCFPLPPDATVTLDKDSLTVLTPSVQPGCGRDGHSL